MLDIKYIKECPDEVIARLATKGKDAKEEIARIYSESKFSRLLVYDNTIDTIVGIVHQKDFYTASGIYEGDLNDIITPPVFTQKNEKIDNLLRLLQKNKSHIAVVLDEYGGTFGIVTMEDILEELVGEIWDEQDEEFSNIEKIDECSYKVLTNVTIDEFFAFFELDFDDEIESTTVNGWIAERCGAIPEKDFSFDYENITVTVTKANVTISAPQIEGWTYSEAAKTPSASFNEEFAKDSNGVELLDGDSVTVIKDLKVKGSSMVIKRGTKVKSIRLTENPEEVDCKIDGSSIVLKTCFLKK